MKYSTIEDVMASLSRPILPTVEGEPDYQTIHATRKFLQSNSRAIDTHLVGGALGHLGLIIHFGKHQTPRAVTSNNGWNSSPNQRRSPQQINAGYAQIFATGHFMIACRWWNEKNTIGKTWTQFKSHFAAAHRQHKQMQGKSAATAGYHSVNAAVTHNEDQMTEATIGALANLETATTADRGVVAALTQANSRLAKQLEDNSNELRELKALLKKERSEKCGQRSFNPSPSNYCCTNGYKVGSTHTSLTCKL
jgi:hypothetical protein